ncbi:MAG: outer membrane protein [Bacteriovoracaceae bacterium]|nr:outer membrane protein [Bacteriovoracaceae bacterium]
MNFSTLFHFLGDIKTTGFRFAIYCSLIIGGSRAFAASEPVLTIQNAVKRAIENNPSVRDTREKIQEGKALKGLAISNVLPSINGVGSYTRKKDASNGSNSLFQGQSYNSYSYAIQGTQPLFAWGILPAIEAADQEIAVRKSNIAISARDLTVSVIQSFYQVILNQRSMDTLKRERGVYEQILQTSRYRFKIGRGESLDVLQIETEIAALDPKIVTAGNGVKTSAAQLANLLGDFETKSVTVEGILEAPPILDIDNRVKTLTSSIPEFERQRASIEEMANSKSISASKYWPQLNAVGSWGKTGYKLNSLVDDYATIWSAGVQLTVPIFTGLGSIHDAHVYESRVAQLQIEDVQLRQNVSTDQITAKENLDTAWSVIHFSEITLDLAKKTVADARQKYKTATIDYIRLLTAEQSLLDAEVSFDQAKFNYISALTTYFQKSGYPLETLVQILSEQHA